MTIINQTNLSVFTLPEQGKHHRFGSIAVPLTINFSLDPTGTFQLDLQTLQALNYIDAVKTLWIDNTGNSFAVTVTFQQSGQEILFPSGFQGYVEIVAPNPPIITFQSAIGGTATTTKFQLLNYSVAGVTWQTNSAQIFGTTLVGVTGSLSAHTMFTIPAGDGHGTLMILSGFVLINSTNGVGSFSFSATFTDNNNNVQTIANVLATPNLATGQEFATPALSFAAKAGTPFQLTITATGVTGSNLTVKAFGSLIS